MQQKVKTSYGNIAVLDNGRDAPAIVFVHGNSYSKEAFARQFDSEQLQAFRLLALDLPGHGESDDAVVPEECYCMRHYATMLREVLDALSISPRLVFGWSLGGHIAIEAMAQGLDAGGLVICGTPPFGPGIEGMENAFLPSEHMELTGKTEFDAEEARLYAQATLGGDDFVAQVLRCDGRARQQMLSDWMSPDAGHNAVEFISHWEKPIAVLHGQAEPFVPLQYLQDLPWKNLWRGEVQLLEESGHAPFWQQAEAVNRLLCDFANECA
jgi:pimeloyl-ACP methyl ester carboxylesterase